MSEPATPAPSTPPTPPPPSPARPAASGPGKAERKVRLADPIKLSELQRTVLAKVGENARASVTDKAIAVLTNPEALRLVLETAKLGPVTLPWWSDALLHAHRALDNG